MTVDPLFAQWLQRDADYVLVDDDVIATRWGVTAVTSERITGIATRAAAEIEAARNLTFFGRGPFAVDTHQLTGTDWAAQLGRVVTLATDSLGYDAGVDVFVLEVEIDRITGMTSVTVLTPLRDLS